MKNKIGPSLLVIAAAADKKEARHITNKFESYRLPKHIMQSYDDVDSDKLSKQFVSFEQELHTPEGQAALQATTAVVVCSPNAVSSSEVSDWLKAYLTQHGYHRLLCYIIAGEPNATDKSDEKNEAFPKEVRFRVDQQGHLTEQRFEPIAADARKKGDGVKTAFVKLAAGVFGVRFADLQQRVLKRKRQKIMAAFAALIAIVSFLGFLQLEQNKQARNKQHEEFNASLKQAYELANKELDVEAKRQLELADSLAQTNEERLLTEKLQRRLKLSHPIKQSLFESQTFDGFIKSENGSSIGALYKHKNAVNLAIANDEATHSYQLKGVTILNKELIPSLPKQGEMLSYSLQEDKFWYLVATSESAWQMHVLDLKTKAIQSFPEQAGELLDQFANLAPLLQSNVLKSLNQGWTAYIENGSLTLKNFANSQEFRLTDKKFETQREIAQLWFSPFNARVFIRFNTSTDIHVWHLDDNSLVNEVPKDIASHIRSSDRNLKYFITNHEISDSGNTRKYAVLTNTSTFEQTHFDNVHLFGVVDIDSMIFKGEDTESLHYALIKLDLSNESVIWTTRNSRWHHGMGLANGAIYAQGNPGEIIRIDATSGEHLLSIKTTCTRDFNLRKVGTVDCLTESGHWISYNVSSFMKQDTIHIGKQVKNLYHQNPSSVILRNTEDDAHLIRFDWKNSSLTHFSWPKRCFGNAISVAQRTWLVSFEKGHYQAFLNQCSEAMSTNQNLFNNDYVLAWFNETQGFSSSNPIVHLQNIPLLNATFARENLYVNPGEFHWDNKTQSFNWANDFWDDAELPDGSVLEYGIHTSDLSYTVLVLRDGSNYKIMGFDPVTKQLGQTFKQFSLANNQTYQLGFVPNSHWFWFSLLNADDKQIHWFATDNETTNCPAIEQFESQFGFMRFSTSGKFALITELNPIFESKIVAFPSGETLHRGSITQDMEFHQTLPYVRLNNQVHALNRNMVAISIDFPGTVLIHQLHPNQPLAAGLCGGKVCVANIETQQVEFVGRNSGIASLVKFFDEDHIAYVQNGKLVVKQLFH